MTLSEWWKKEAERWAAAAEDAAKATPVTAARWQKMAQQAARRAEWLQEAE